MKTPLYLDILSKTLLPFLRGAYPNGHGFMQDNDPKHGTEVLGGQQC